jgi:hypothetical protein
MRSLALLFAFLIGLIGVGIIGLAALVAPDRLMAAVAAASPYVLTPVGLYAIGALRVGMGIVLILAARNSRAPGSLRALGAVVLVAGFATPLFGVERSRAVADWAVMHSPAAPLVAGLVLLAIACFIAFAVSKRRRRA